jgi:hypothetical protein
VYELKPFKVRTRIVEKFKISTREKNNMELFKGKVKKA